MFLEDRDYKEHSEDDVIGRTSANEFLIPAASALIPDHDPVLRPFVDRASMEQGQISEIVADILMRSVDFGEFQFNLAF